MKEIGSSVFSGCTSLSSVTLPKKLKAINGSLFSNCSSLTSITLPNSVKTIDDEAFDGCSALTSIIIPNSVTHLGHGAFCNCISLASVTFPINLTKIQNDILCKTFTFSIDEIEDLSKYFDTIPFEKVTKYLFENCPALQIINVPTGKKEEYCKLGLEPYRTLIQEIE